MPQEEKKNRGGRREEEGEGCPPTVVEKQQLKNKKHADAKPETFPCPFDVQANYALKTASKRPACFCGTGRDTHGQGGQQANDN